MKFNFLHGLLCGAFFSSSGLTLIYHLDDLKSPPSPQLLNNAQSAEIDTNPKPRRANFDRGQTASFDETYRFQKSQDIRSLQPLGNETPTPPETCKVGLDCPADALATILANEDLTQDRMDNIKNNSDGIARLLSQDEAALNAYTNQLISTSDEEKIDALFTIVSLLPEAQALKIIRNSTGYSEDHKKSAIHALSTLSAHSEDAVKEIENILISENDPDVMAAALRALETVDNYDLSPQLWQDMANEFSTLKDNNLKGSILFALAKHSKTDRTELISKLDEGLDSNSTDLVISSLAAISYVFSDDRNNDSLSALGFERYKSKIEELSIDKNLDISLRMEALLLLEEQSG